MSNFNCNQLQHIKILYTITIWQDSWTQYSNLPKQLRCRGPFRCRRHFFCLQFQVKNQLSLSFDVFLHQGNLDFWSIKTRYRSRNPFHLVDCGDDISDEKTKSFVHWLLGLYYRYCMVASFIGSKKVKLQRSTPRQCRQHTNYYSFTSGTEKRHFN